MEIVNCACILLDMNLEYRSNVRYAVLVKVAAVQRKKKHCSSMLITATHIGTTTYTDLLLVGLHMVRTMHTVTRHYVGSAAVLHNTKEEVHQASAILCVRCCCCRS